MKRLKPGQTTNFIACTPTNWALCGWVSTSRDSQMGQGDFPARSPLWPEQSTLHLNRIHRSSHLALCGLAQERDSFFLLQPYLQLWRSNAQERGAQRSASISCLLEEPAQWWEGRCQGQRTRRQEPQTMLLHYHSMLSFAGWWKRDQRQIHTLL